MLIASAFNGPQPIDDLMRDPSGVRSGAVSFLRVHTIMIGPRMDIRCRVILVKLNTTKVVPFATGNSGATIK